MYVKLLLIFCIYTQKSVYLSEYIVYKFLYIYLYIIIYNLIYNQGGTPVSAFFGDNTNKNISKTTECMKKPCIWLLRYRIG